MNILESRRRTLGKGVYKKTVEGNPAIAQGSLARRYPGITMQGWTEQDSTTGAQLFDASAVKNGFVSAAKIGEKFSFDANQQYSNAQYVEVPVTKYVVSYDFSKNINYEDDIRLRFSDDNGICTNGTVVGDVKNGTAFDAKTTKIYVMALNGFINIDTLGMMNYGKTLIPYEPYTGRAPSPSPDYPQEIVSAGSYNEVSGKYKVDVTLGGAQLWQNIETPITQNGVTVTLDEEGYFVLNGMCTTSYNFIFRNVTLHTGQYTLSMQREGNFPDSELLLQIYSATNGSLCGLNNNSVSTSATGNVKSASNDYEFRIRIDAGFNYNNSKVRPMLNIGSTALPYEPYKPPQTVTLTSDRPLTKWDKLEKRNGQWGWVYKSAEIVLDGSETWFLTGATSDEYQRFALKSSDYNAMNSNLRLVCDKFAYSTSDKINTCRQEKSEYGLRFVVSTEYVPNKTVADWENWLQSNPITVLYQLAEPTFVPLSESEQEQMNELYTFRPTTVLSNDAGCNMALTYKTKKSLQSVPGGGIKKSSGITSYFNFGIKWNQVNKIVFKISGVTERNNNMLLSGSSMSTPYIALSNGYLYPMLNNFSASISAEEVSDGEYHEIVFTFDTPLSNRSIVNMWDGTWSKTIIYHEIAFYDGDDLLADYVPYHKGAGYMLDKKNNVVIRATNPEDYQFA